MYIRIEIIGDNIHKEIRTQDENEAVVLLDCAIKEVTAVVNSRLTKRAADACKKCGTNFIEGAKFCFECGKRR